MITSFAELQEKVYPYGKIGRYLFEQMVEFNMAVADLNPDWPKGESWSLGDSPVVGLMLDPHDYAWTMREAPTIDENMKYHFDANGRQIRVYNEIDSRFILEDMFAKLKINYGKDS